MLEEFGSEQFERQRLNRAKEEWCWQPCDKRKRKKQATIWFIAPF